MIAPLPVFKATDRAGFTLVELSIVLVIIGLIIGGVLVGRDLISAATVRAQISQIEKYNAAVNTFRGKYGYLPGDIPNPVAAQYGFTMRGSNPGEGDGNGIMEGIYGTGGTNYGYVETTGENAMFWVDLSAANLLDGSFSTASPTTTQASPLILTGASLNLYLPPAKLGGGNYIYVWSQNNTNYYGMGGITQLFNYGALYTSRSVTVQQAYNIDVKMDDGMPQSGRVTAQEVGSVTPTWVDQPPGGTVDGRNNLTCYDNYPNWVPPGVMTYSLKYNNGNGINCDLSFQFQ